MEGAGALQGHQEDHTLVKGPLVLVPLDWLSQKDSSSSQNIDPHQAQMTFS